MRQFGAFDGSAFEHWLAHRLTAQYSLDDDTRYRAFDLREFGIARGESHLDVVMELGLRLDGRARDSLTEGVLRLFRHADPATFPREGMSDLIVLIGRLKDYGALGGFAAVLGAGPWGERYPTLVFDALGVLLAFDRAPEAYRAIRALATAVNFRDGYVFDAYGALVRGCPAAWVDDMDLLRPRFWRVRTAALAGEPAVQRQVFLRELRLAHVIGRAVPLSLIAEQLHRVKLRPHLDSLGQATTDWWLLKALCSNEGPFRLEYSDHALGLVLVDRSDRARVAPIPDSPDLDLVCHELFLVEATRPSPARPLPEDVHERLCIASRPRQESPDTMLQGMGNGR